MTIIFWKVNLFGQPSTVFETRFALRQMKKKTKEKLLTKWCTCMICRVYKICQITFTLWKCWPSWLCIISYYTRNVEKKSTIYGWRDVQINQYCLPSNSLIPVISKLVLDKNTSISGIIFFKVNLPTKTKKHPNSNLMEDADET